MPYYNYLTRYKADFFFRSLTLRNSILDLKTLKAFFHTKNIKEAKALKKSVSDLNSRKTMEKKQTYCTNKKMCRVSDSFHLEQIFSLGNITIEIERNIRINRFNRLFEVTASCTNDCNDDDEFSRKF